MIRKSGVGDRQVIEKLLNDLDLGYKGQSFDDIWVAEEGGKVVSVAELKEYDDYYFLSSVGTTPAAQGGGIATLLLNIILHGINKPVYLYTIIPEFFARLDFKPVDFSDKLPARTQYNCAACQSSKCVCMVRRVN